jgi:phosphoribosylanthranilate isomerase
VRPAARPRVKVCCISSLKEARLAVDYGASALGLVSEMPSGPGVIPDEAIAEIAASAPPGVATFLLTSRTDGEAIARQARTSRVSTVQLCDRVPGGQVAVLRAACPGLKVVAVVHVKDARAVDEAVEAAASADAVLLDSGDPDRAVKELGGTGRLHDWAVSGRIRETLDVPLFLAGGLTPENVADAVRQVRPYGLDVCSGLRTGGRLDERKVARFFDALSGSLAPGSG